MKINDYKLIKIKLYFYVFILIVAFFIGFFTDVVKENNNLTSNTIYPGAILKIK